MTITLTEQDIAAYRARVAAFNNNVLQWNFHHAGPLMRLSASETDQHAHDMKLAKYMQENNYPRLSLFDL